MFRLFYVLPVIFLFSCGGGESDMVEIGLGEFEMGCTTQKDPQCASAEQPAHSVILNNYKIDKYEVTTEDYQKCIDEGVCKNTSEDKPHYKTNKEDMHCNLGFAGKEKHPVQCVTWYGADAYCAWLGKRLPSEAEWEKAARGNDGRKYAWGSEPLSCELAVYGNEVLGDGCGAKGTNPVGTKEKGKSPYGVYDMTGNVAEWVNDWYNQNYYASSPAANPTGPETGTMKLIRGGSWKKNDPDFADMRIVYRVYPYSPNFTSSEIGFRCAQK